MKTFWIFSLLGGLLSSCTSYDQWRYITEEYEVPSKVFSFDYNQTWLAVRSTIRDRFDIDYQNQESGVIKTRWIDNTLETNFADSFGSTDSVKSARHKIIINVVKGFRGNQEVSKVTVWRRQMVEQDFLQGWKVVPSDGILEKTLLYRIERNLVIEDQLNKIDEKKAKELENSF